jgi:Tol biopolymer transport system component
VPNTLQQIKSLGSAAGLSWRSFRGDIDGLGAFIGDTVIDPSLLEGLYLYDSGEIFNLILGDGQDPVTASLSPDGNLLAYVSRDPSGRATLFMMNVVNGFYTPIFSEPDGALLDDDAPLWSRDGKLLLIVIEDVNPDGTRTPNVYSIDLTVLNAVPELILRNLSDPTFSEDGELLAFVRDRNVFIQLSRDAIPRQLTNQPEGTTCDSPFFDTAGINLYFICRSGEEASLVVQGFDGLQPVSTGLTVVTTAELGPVDGILTVGDGRRVFIVGMDGLNLKPLIDLGDLDVDGFGWAD